MLQRSIEQDYAVAIHESAHTFAFLHFDLSVEYVTIDPDEHAKTVRLGAVEIPTIETLSKFLNAVPTELWTSPFENVLGTLVSTVRLFSENPDLALNSQYVNKLGSINSEFNNVSRESLGLNALDYLNQLDRLLSKFIDIVLSRAGHVHGETSYRTSPTKSLTAGQKVKAENIAIVCAAGYEAARHLPGESSFGGFSDDVAMKKILEDVSQFPGDKAEKIANERLVRARALALVTQYRTGIELLANQLLIARRMNGSEVRVFLLDHGISIARLPRLLF